MKKLALIITFLLPFIYSCENLDLDPAALTNEEVIQGLKSALIVGTDTSVGILHTTDGYFADEAVKIFLPPEAQVIYDNLSLIPGGDLLIANTIKSMNRAAEDAAAEATPIFIDAITDITIADGFDILYGSDSAATLYLENKTYNNLEAAFEPKVMNSLSKPLILGQSTESIYGDLLSTYNTVADNSFGLIDSITENSLSTHVTRRALDGLFLKVQIEEMKIRENPLHRVNDILKKVFGELD